LRTSEFLKGNGAGEVFQGATLELLFDSVLPLGIPDGARAQFAAEGDGSRKRG
jgi:hypothetical protein